jgi:hypothetical protein
VEACPVPRRQQLSVSADELHRVLRQDLVVHAAADERGVVRACLRRRRLRLRSLLCREAHIWLMAVLRVSVRCTYRTCCAGRPTAQRRRECAGVHLCGRVQLALLRAGRVHGLQHHEHRCRKCLQCRLHECLPCSLSSVALGRSRSLSVSVAQGSAMRVCCVERYCVWVLLSGPRCAAGRLRHGPSVR